MCLYLRGICTQKALQPVILGVRSVILGVQPVILGVQPVILSVQPVILSEAKDLREAFSQVAALRGFFAFGSE